MAEGTLRSVGDLVSEGLVPADEAASITAVAERYAIALMPTVRALIDTSAPDTSTVDAADAADAAQPVDAADAADDADAQ